AEVDSWLNGHGWRATAEPALQVQRQLGRPVEVEVDDEDSFSTFVTAEKS
ncbi:MAG: SAM-dependent methyltransferase, partial [Mycobacteriaceae bacterium]|nr:SAM-dependent methyltransferase [Mycobacteriaceae bacterium]